MRREEAATLCGISPTWYTWIEQGRTSAISVETLGAIARGLRLSRAERTYLFELASRADPTPPPQEEADPHRLAELMAVVSTPAYVLDRHWDAIAWNDPAAELFEDWLGHAPWRDAGRNLLRYVFLHPGAPSFIVDWPERARRLVAEFRADSAAWNEDPVRRAFVDELSWESAPFEAAWQQQNVRAREGGMRRFQHPRRGLCLYEQFTLRVAQRTELKMTVLVLESPSLV